MSEMKIGVIGTGAIGQTHIERINTKLQGARVIACADPNADFCKSIAEKFSLKAYDDPKDMINADDIEAVVVTAADNFHEEYVLAAIEAGKYVFCEKPLAPESNACRKIVDAEIAGGKQLVQVGFMRRYDPGYRQLKELIDSGDYGAPLMLHCAHRNPEVSGFTTEMSVENSLIHEIDVLRWLLGENYETAEVVFPRTTRNAEGELRDPQIMYLTTESGIRIDVESFVNCKYGYDIKCEVVCEEGTLTLPEPANVMKRVDAARVTPICRDWSERFVDAYNIEFQEWINACKEGRVDGPTAWDGYVGQVTAAAASKARDAQSVMTIEFDEKPAFYN
ncbi:Gfo/Idh/MocA family oxidoreductase [Enterococcus sp. 669A]|uniref:Inositol 2-dehydrogenase/D-chiro-inositol 3-dehydrogenase n=1 Tax=Candidatus Enterococcus moelleringii TaxID=2815325 RepID=A0ABS3LEB9_9ENTE|nr:Gfo/Idh/MocA family oxidoreductase [Enterococcus sp. 669A]MBO1307096.1 Gfo/Idh/MocA family oxidoreductase [Enterococcus sp. 669A]